MRLTAALAMCFLFCASVLANTRMDDFQVYLQKLVEETVISDSELLTFAKHLENNEMVNPIDCHKECTSIRVIHRDNLEEYLKEDLNLHELKDWIDTLLKQRGVEHVQRDETREQTKSLWKRVRQVISGSCVIDNEHKVSCFGERQPSSRALQVLEGLGKVIQVQHNEGIYGCVLNEFGRIRCWGYNDYGQQNFPANIGRVVQISCSDYHMCALDDQGKVLCWGQTRENGHIEDSKVIAVPPNLNPVSQISIGKQHTCAIEQGGSVVCWGHMQFRQTNPPQDLGRAVQISTGYNHSCALEESGQLRCWGGDSLANMNIVDPGPFVQVSSAHSNACALTLDGSVTCYGLYGDWINKATKNLEPLVQIATRHMSFCGVTRKGRVLCADYTGKVTYPAEGVVVLTEGLN